MSVLHNYDTVVVYSVCGIIVKCVQLVVIDVSEHSYQLQAAVQLVVRGEYNSQAW